PGGRMPAGHALVVWRYDAKASGAPWTGAPDVTMTWIKPAFWPPQARWQATSRPATGRSSGVSTEHLSTAIGQRGWKAQPVGMLSGDGNSPSRRTRCCVFVGSAIGVAESSAFV